MPTGQETGWTPETIWTLWKQEKSCSPAENLCHLLDHPAHNLVTLLNELFQLLFMESLLENLRKEGWNMKEFCW
jgi:hypothetical protein